MIRNSEPPTSVRSARVSAVRSLAKKKVRRDEGLFMAEGIQSVREALLWGKTRAGIRELYATASAVAEFAVLNEAVVVSDEIISAMCDTTSPQGVIAVCELPRRTLESLTPENGRVAIFCNVRDPGNAGTIIRSADAFGFDTVIFADGSVDPWSPKVVRSGAGSHWHLPIVDGVESSVAIHWARTQGFEVLATDTRGKVLEMDSIPARSAWLFGNEAWGITAEIEALVDSVVKIPMCGVAESLNLATAAGIVFFLVSQAR